MGEGRSIISSRLTAWLAGTHLSAHMGKTARAIVIGAIGLSPSEIDALEALDLMYVGMNIMS
jgi:hypothetical protein